VDPGERHNAGGGRDGLADPINDLIRRDLFDAVVE
jgi:hypothetical protein